MTYRLRPRLDRFDRQTCEELEAMRLRTMDHLDAAAMAGNQRAIHGLMRVYRLICTTQAGRGGRVYLAA